MVRPITAAPNSLTTGKTRIKEASSPFTELIRGLPGNIAKAAIKASRLAVIQTERGFDSLSQHLSYGWQQCNLVDSRRADINIQYVCACGNLSDSQAADVFEILIRQGFGKLFTSGWINLFRRSPLRIFADRRRPHVFRYVIQCA